MLHPVYISQNGEPKTGLSPDWESLLTMENATDKSGSAPAISEIDGGWYKFNITFGTAPWDVTTEDLVGVIDADPSGSTGLIGSERYIPVTISLRGLSLARIAHKGVQTKSSGDIDIFQTDGSTKEMKLNMTDSSSTISRVPTAP